MNVVVVTGLSGAGRSTALRSLEDLGYYAVDNLPPPAFSPTLAACERSRLTRIALGIDVRVPAFLEETLTEIRRLRRVDAVECDVLFLDAAEPTLLSRFSATRRPHPLGSTPASEADAGQGPSLAVLDGIRLERERLAPLRAEASVVVDTSDLSVHDLRRRVVELFRPRQGLTRQMLTRFVSFGFKYGAPVDADVVFDVRFLRNPYFEPELQKLSGLDEQIQLYVLGQSAAQQFIDHVVELLRFLIPQYQAEGKSYLTVAFGCTGGRHRSIVLAHRVAEILRDTSLAPIIETVERDVNRDVR